MSLLLDNIKMPRKYPVSLTVWPDGIYVATTISGRKFTGSVREILKNERLIDANAVYGACSCESRREDGAITLW